jgi:DNA modification methylase
LSNTGKKGAQRIEQRDIASLRPHANNPRKHSNKQLKQIQASIRRFGFTNPVLVDEKNSIIAGHGRVEAAKSLGLANVPVIVLSGLSVAEYRAYIIADNRLAELADWDSEKLRSEVAAILEADEDFDLELTGFDGGELEALLAAIDTGGGPEDVIPDVDKAAQVSGRGDMWLLGKHRLICGDARDPEVYHRLLGEDRAQMVITDPPYNVSVNGHICGLGKVQHAEFMMASGEMSEVEFEALLREVLTNLAAFSTDGSIHYVFMDWRHMRELLSAGLSVYDELKNLIVWNKTNGGMGSFYRSKHELAFAFKKGTGAHINNFELGQHGRYRTNVWDYPGISSMGPDRGKELAMHPTVKPVAMIADAIRDCSKRGGIVLDAFSGSGTTIMAAEQTGRRGYAIELDPLYVDVAVRRWQAETGKEAVLSKSGNSFDNVARMLD